MTETISRTDEGQPRPKYIFNKCGTHIYFFNSTEVWSIAINEFKVKHFLTSSNHNKPNVYCLKKVMNTKNKPLILNHQSALCSPEVSEHQIFVRSKQNNIYLR